MAACEAVITCVAFSELGLWSVLLGAAFGVASFVLLRKSATEQPRRNARYLASSCMAIVYSVSIVIGSQLDNSSEIIWSFFTVLRILSIGLIAFGAMSFLMLKLDQCSDGGLFERHRVVVKGRTKAAVFIAVMIPQVLVYLVVFPGVYGYDAGFHLLQFFDEQTSLTSAYSVPYTLFLGSCINFGQIYFNNAESGFALAMLLQSVFLCAVSSYAAIVSYRETGSRVILVLSVLFFAVFPPFLIMRVSSAQDALFGGFFLLLVVQLFECSKLLKSGLHKKDMPLVIGLAVSALCLFLLRNNGIYAFAVMLVLAIPVLAHFKRLGLGVVLLVPVALYCLISGPVYSLMGVQPGAAVGISSAREMLSVPSQQIARVSLANPDALSPEEWQLLDKYYLDESFDYYWVNPSISDLQKAEIDSNEITKDPLGYIRLYCSLGIKDPGNYIEAFLMNSLGFWYPGKQYPDPRMYHLSLIHI